MSRKKKFFHQLEEKIAETFLAHVLRRYCILFLDAPIYCEYFDISHVSLSCNMLILMVTFGQQYDCTAGDLVMGISGLPPYVNHQKTH